MKIVYASNLTAPDPDETVVPVIMCEELTDKEMAEYINLFTSEEVRERLQTLLNEEDQMTNIIPTFDVKDVPASDLYLIDDQLDNNTKEAHSEWASDAKAEIEAVESILISLAQAQKLHRDEFVALCLHLDAAKGWLNNMILLVNQKGENHA